MLSKKRLLELLVKQEEERNEMIVKDSTLRYEIANIRAENRAMRVGFRKLFKEFFPTIKVIID